MEGIGSLSRVRRSLSAFLLAATLAALLAGGGPASAAVPRAGSHIDVARPRTVWKPIPFGSDRKAQMAAYSKRHYGTSEWRLRSPRVIVEHYTASDDFASAYWTFYGNEPDSELHERPGVCAHFIIDRDGTIYQLVALGTRCRHTVGLNYTAIGIEHVGHSDGQVLSNRRQLQASLALTAYLMARFDIPLGNVIGHNESLQSRLFRERYTQWRCRTHGDFRRESMDAYRKKLRQVAGREGLDTSAPRWRDRGC